MIIGKTDYDYIVLSIIPQQDTDKSQDSGALCSCLSTKQSQGFDYHHYRV